MGNPSFEVNYQTLQSIPTWSRSWLNHAKISKTIIVYLVLFQKQQCQRTTSNSSVRKPVWIWWPSSLNMCLCKRVHQVSDRISNLWVQATRTGPHYFIAATYQTICLLYSHLAKMCCRSTDNLQVLLQKQRHTHCKSVRKLNGCPANVCIIVCTVFDHLDTKKHSTLDSEINTIL